MIQSVHIRAETMKIILLLACLVCNNESARILGIFPLSGSHHILASSLMKGLAQKEHNVTMISPFEAKNPPNNYRDIVISTTESRIQFDLFDLEKMDFITFQLLLNSMGNSISENVLKHPNVQNLLQSNEEFDVVIVEQFLNDALKIFAHHYKAPLVLFVTFGSNVWINSLVSNPAPPSYIAEQAIRFDHRNFFDRLANTIIYIFGEINRNLLFYPAQNRIMKKYFPEAPDLDTLLYNASLVLLNSHVSTNKAVPRVPSMVDIGGFHIKPPQILPSHLQEYLDNAKDGAIYFSMGSGLRSADMPKATIEAFLKAFSKLRENVLWKWEEDALPGQPENVKLGKWLPQQEILAHPNVKLFITHGGLLSMIESVFHGVPQLAIPIFGDQQINTAHIVSNEFGLCINYREVDEEKLTKAINEMLNNPKYRDNMKKRSQIMKDRQNQPIDDADFWIRYVIKHKGATHLRVDGLQLPWYQYLSLDVAAFLLAVTLLITYICFVVLRFICKTLCGKNNKKLKTN